MPNLILPRLNRTSPLMKKLDRLDWAAGISFVSYDLRIGIRVNETAFLDQSLDCLPPGWRSSCSTVVDRLYSLIARPGSFDLLYVGEERLIRTRDREELLYTLESNLQLHVAEMARNRVFVHAGVVGWEGKAIVIPGQSYTGKSTLVAALVRAGATYYSDEYAVFDSQGFVHPYPRALAIRVEGKGLPARYAVEAMGGRCGRKPLPVGLVAVTEYRAGARWRPRTLSPGKAVLALMTNTVSIRRQPGIALAKLKEVVARARAVRSSRGEAIEIIGDLFEALTMRSPARPT
jgi:hypothetical protein